MRTEYASLEPVAKFGENGGVLARIVTFVLPLGLDTLAIAIALGHKPNARLFAARILVIGLILRGLAAERAERRVTSAAAINRGKKSNFPCHSSSRSLKRRPGNALAVRGIGRTLDFAIQEAKDTNRPLYILFVREQPVIAPEDRKRKWIKDDEARAIFTYAKDNASGHRLLPAYAISDSPADTIVDIAATVGASYLIVDAPQRNALVNLLRGNIIRNISSILPEEIHFLVYA